MTAERRELEAQNWIAIKRAYGWYFVMSLGVALVVPNEILSSWPFLFNFVNWVSSFVPSISALAMVSAFPEVTSLTVALMWAMFPVVTVHFFFLLSLPQKKLTKRQWIVVGVGLPLVIAVCTFLTFFLPRPPSPEYMNYTSGRGAAAATYMARSRLGLGLSSLLMIVNSFLLVLVGKFVLTKLLSRHQ